MREELNTPGWAGVFENQPVVALGITREDVVEIIRIHVPNHEPQEGCEFFCSTQFYGLFRLKNGQFLGLRANCNKQMDGFQRPCLGSSQEEVLYEFSPADRALLGLSFPDDEEPDYSDA